MQMRSTTRLKTGQAPFVPTCYRRRLVRQTRRLRWQRVGLAGFGLVALAGTFAGCGRDKSSSLGLRLQPDSSCSGVPLGCVETLDVVLAGDGTTPSRSWRFDFQVPGGQAPLDGLPTSGSGRFRVAGLATGLVLAFSGTSQSFTFRTEDQDLPVPVSCVIPPTCGPVPGATPTPFQNGQNAVTVLGQDNFSRCNRANNGFNEQNELAQPEGILADYAGHDRLWVAEREGNRLSTFGSLAAITSGAAIDFVVCQNNSGDVGNSGNGANRCNRPYGVGLLPARLAMADSQNHRTPVFDPIPAANNASSAVALGQPNNTGADNPNQGGVPAANTLNLPWGVAVSGTSLWIADSGNHRILRYDPDALANDLPATLVLGQAAFDTNAANGGGASASTLSSPAHVASDGTWLWAADRANNRVLGWRIATLVSNGTPAQIVLGQATFTDVDANRGGAIAADTMNLPRSVHADANRLVVADSGNHRVLIWQPVPTTNGAPATAVLGQPDFTTGTPNFGGSGANCPNVGAAGDVGCNLGQEPPTAASLARPGAVWISGDRLWVADSCNHRALLYEPLVTPGR